MGVSFRLCQISAGENIRDIGSLERRLSDDFKPESPLACALGESWRFVNVLLTGEQYSTAGVSGLILLGGQHVATFEDPTDVLIVLDEVQVEEVAEFLRRNENEVLLDRNRHALEVFFRGALRPGLMENFLNAVDQLRMFYESASLNGNTVAKRLIGFG
ncbi:DUF1877 family protein [Streptomyces sp. NPDC046805]|uniref:DUF1877 family protein n=1 Tax=Streptomyces sp. NPDC046805 TaxID=3155134 RepID=UPI00340C6D14